MKSVWIKIYFPSLISKISVFSIVGLIIINLIPSIYLGLNNESSLLVASLEINKTVNTSTPLTGETFVYRLQYRCASLTDDCIGTVITDPLPPEVEFLNVLGSSHTTNEVYDAATHTVTFTFQNILTAGTSGQVQINVRFPNGSTSNGTVASNTATLSATNAVSVTSSVNATAVASAIPEYEKDFVNGGAPDVNTTYQVQFCNNLTGNNAFGTLTLRDITIVDTLPVGTVFVSPNINWRSSYTYDPGSRVLTIYRDSLAPGECMWPRFTMIYPTPTYNVGTSVSNTAYWTYTPEGDVPTTVTDTHTFNLTSASSRAYTYKNASSNSYYQGSPGTYELGGENNGTSTIADFCINDTIPDGMEVERFSMGGWYYGGLEEHEDRIDVYYTTNLNGPTLVPGSPFSIWDPEIFISVSGDLGLVAGGPEYITSINFCFGNIPAGFADYDPIRIEFEVRSNATVGTRTNCAEMTTSSSGVTFYENCVDVDIVQALAGSVPDPYKNYLENGKYFNIGETITMTLRPQNGWIAGQAMSNPSVYDLLPPEVDYVPGSWYLNYPNPVGIPDPIFTETPNFRGTGRTLLQWDWTGASSHDFNPNSSVWIYFDVVVNDNAYGGANSFYNEMILRAEEAAECWGDDYTDVYDLDNDGDNTELFCANSVGLNINSYVSLESEKLVKGQLDTEWTKYPETGYTVPGGLADYQLIVRNQGNIQLDNIVVIDILPFVGDEGVIDLNSRDSRWRPNLVGSVSAPAGVTVYYSTEGNPCRSAEQIEPSGPASCSAANWTIVPPSDITTVQSLKFEFGSTVLNPNDSLVLEWPMRAPVTALATIGAQPDSIAWNSFGYIGQRVDNDDYLLATEPIKVGISMNTSVPAVIGDYVWIDDNQNGRQNGGELGYDGMRVELFRDDGDGVANPNVDEFVNFTVTANGGFYLFPYLPSGDYFLVYYKPAPFGVTTANAGGDDAIDSDGVLTTYNGFAVAITPVTNLSGIEYDLDWDLGVYPNGLSAVGNYVWSDANNDGIQNESSSDGVNGVVVNLYENSNPSVVFQSVTTSDDFNGNPGYYLFDQLAPGDYFLEFVLPGSTTFASQGSNGSSDPTDSDVNTSTGRTEVISLAADVYDDTWDAGLILSGTEVCDNGIDDDLDGFTDEIDPDCGCNMTIVDADIISCTDSLTLNTLLTWTGGGDGSITLNANGSTATIDLSGGITSPYGYNIRVLNDGSPISLSATLDNGSTLCSASESISNTCTEICNDGIDNDGDGDADYLDSDCDCPNFYPGPIDFDFSNASALTGTGLNLGDQILYSNVGDINGQTVDIVATVDNLVNLTTLEEHGFVGSGDNAIVELPSMRETIGTEYYADIRYELFESGNSTPISGSFEIEIADIDSISTARVEIIGASQTELDFYFLNTPSNLQIQSSNNYLTATGTENQSSSEPDGAIKYSFINKNTFTLRYGMRQHLSTSTGRAAFIIDGNSFDNLGECITGEICNDGIDNDGDGLLDCFDCEDCFDSSDCNDNDSDGISNICDLDDDNDGIRDEEERCAESTDLVNALIADDLNNAASDRNPYISISTDLSIIEGAITNIIDGDFTQPNGTVQFIANQNITNQTIWEVNYNRDIYLAYIENDVTNAGSINDPSFLAIGAEVQYQYFDENTSTWKNLANVYSMPDTLQTGTGGTITLNVNHAEVIQGGRFRLYGISGSTNSDASIKLENLALGLSTFANDYACICDYDNDGIPNKFDLDSDGDGCPDAIEGSASFGDIDMITSSISGGNSGGAYTGSSSIPITDNLGNTVEMTSSSSDFGIPTVAGGGQGVGTSQNPAATACGEISGSVFEDINYGGGDGRNYSEANTSAQSSGWPANAIQVTNARVELYDNTGSFVASTNTDSNGEYLFTDLTTGNYSVRVVNNTVASNRASNSTGETIIPVQTYRTDNITPVINEVGGAAPSLIDANANTTNANISTLASATTAAQSVTSITLGTADVSDIDFGYNFDVVVNINDSGQGSLRQFILNSNELDNTNLDQEDNPTNGVSFPKDAEWETSIFMIPGAGTHTIEPLSSLPSIEDPQTHVSAYTQTGSAQGTIASRTINVELDGNGNNYDGLTIYSSDVEISGFAIHSFRKGIYANRTNAVNNFIWGNYIGTEQDGITMASNSSSGIDYRNILNSAIGTNGDNINDVNEGNIISNSYYGIDTRNSGNLLVAGNYVGLDKTGTVDFGNQYVGVYLGTAASANYVGFRDDLTNTNATHFRNVIGGNGNDAVRISDSDNQVVAGNYLGTDVTGTVAIPNENYGIQLQGVINNNIIGTNSNGDDDLKERNIISGNGTGLRFLGSSSGAGNIIAGNFIGTDVTGNSPLPNENNGMDLSGTHTGTIVGTNGDNINDEVEGNVISGNDEDGIRLGIDNAIVAGNNIGLGYDGSTVLGNGGRGILITLTSSDNVVGYSPVMANSNELVVGNKIMNNDDSGIAISGTGTQNRFSRNQLANNSGLGIDLDYDLVTANDNGDGDSGPNNLLNFPVLEEAIVVGGNLVIKGFAPAGSDIEFFLADAGPNPNPFPSGYTSNFGEGAVYLFTVTEGSVNDADGTTADYVDDGTGASSTKTQNQFEFSVDTTGLNLSIGLDITSTATDANQNTSEFSGWTVVRFTEICNDGIDNDLDGLTDCLDCEDCGGSIAPTFTIGDIPVDITILCSDAIPAAPTVTATDNCGTPTVVFSETDNQSTDVCGQNNYEIIRTWTASDVCGNTISESQTITVVDPTNSCVGSGVIGGTAFLDYNNNGQMDDGLNGLAGVEVYLFENSGGNSVLLDQTLTDVNGSYSFTTGVNAGSSYRVEFERPTGMIETFTRHGADNGTNVQFVTAPSCAVNVGLADPADYCGAQPFMYVSCYSFGAAENNSIDAIVGLPLNPSTGPTENGVIGEAVKHLANAEHVGSIYGMAYSNSKDMIYGASFMKRHVGFGPGGTGAIYQIDPNATTPGASVLVDLNALFGANTAGVDPHPFGDTGTCAGCVGSSDMTNFNCWQYDDASWEAVGTISLGDIDVSDDGEELFVMNLADKMLYRIDIDNPGGTSRYAFPEVDISCGGEVRPFAVEFENNKVYVGAICDEISRDVAMLYVYELDLATATWRRVLEANYQRSHGQANGRFYGWEPFRTWPGGGVTYHNFKQPMLSDISFDNNAMVLGIRDVSGDKIGNDAGRPDRECDLLWQTSSGDIFRAGYNASTDTYEFEENATVNGITTAGLNSGYGLGAFGTSGSSYYFEDIAPNNSDQITLGGLAQLPNGALYTTAYDIIGLYDFGIAAYDNQTGRRVQNYQLSTNTDNLTGFGKANGLGDLEFGCEEAPVEIGNRVWFDENENGIQDVTEIGIQGVSIILLNSLGDTVGTQVTDALGEYYFSDLTLGDSTLRSAETYYIVIGGADYDDTNFLLRDSLELTTPNNGQVPNADINDSDAVLGSGAAPSWVQNYFYIETNTGAPGVSNHDSDFGFKTCFPDVSLVLGDNEECVSNTTLTLTGGTPLGGTYSGPGVNAGNFDASNAGIGLHTITYTYTNASGCTNFATATIRVFPLPVANAGGDVAICINFDTNLSASGGTNYAWSPSTGLSATNTANPTADPLVTTTYTVTVTDGNGCTDTDDVIVTVNNPVVLINTNSPICYGADINLSVASASSYNWTGPNGFTSNQQTPTINSASIVNAGTYRITITDALGCTAINSVEVLVTPCAEDCANGIDDDGDGLIDCADCEDCSTSISCSDNDGDGIGDFCDLDDDNDGIPDLDECPDIVLGPELVINGDFEDAYANWTSDFNRGRNNNNDTRDGCSTQGWIAVSPCATYNGVCNAYYRYDGGTYDGSVVITDPYGTGANVLPTTNCNTNADRCQANILADHTTGIGFSLYVDPSDVSGRAYWKQIVTVEPNKKYKFSAWLMVIEEDPNLQFRIDGVNLTSGFNLDRLTGGSEGTDVWQQFFVDWYSGTLNGSVEIELVNLTAGCGGNDIRLDDVSLREIIADCDCDGDGVDNYLDLDSDNDGIFDVDEAGHTALDANNDGVIDDADIFSGANGLFDGVETATDSDTLNYNIADSEASPDGIFDICELDSDGDGCLDAEEEAVTDPDSDGLAGTGVPIVNTSNGIVLSNTYATPPNNIWQNPLIGPCLSENCGDGLDNDFDGDTDCNDPDCITNPTIILSQNTACINETISISSSDIGVGTTYNWDFGTNANPATASGIGPHNISYTSCGNKIISLTILKNGCTITVDSIIQIIDNTDPVWDVAPQDLIMECQPSANYSDSIALWLASYGNGVVTDNCNSLSISNNYSGLTADCGSTGSTSVQFVATDSCGNSAASIANIQIIDTQGPEIATLSDITVDCDNVPGVVTPTIIDSCDLDLDIVYHEVSVYHPNGSWKSIAGCNLLYAISNFSYDDKSTVDTTDDEMTFSIAIIGQNTGTTWNTTINGSSITGDFYRVYSLGPILSNGSTLSFLVMDTDVSSCSILVDINAADF